MALGKTIAPIYYFVNIIIITNNTWRTLLLLLLLWIHTYMQILVIIMYAQHFLLYFGQRNMDQPGNVANPVHGHQLNEQGKLIFPVRPRSRLRIWSLETSSAGPVPRQSAHCPHSSWIWCLLTRLLSISTAAASIYLYRHPPSVSPEFIRALITHLRTDDSVHCRESAGTGPVVLKV